MSEETGRIYKIVFHNHGQLVELFARHVSQGGLFGFVEVEDLIFGARSQVVVDPSEESLRREFEGVRRIYVPLHSVVRIDEVEREGVGRITETKDGPGGEVRPFPVPIPPRGGD